MEAFGYLLDLSTSPSTAAESHAALLDAYQAIAALMQERGEETPTAHLSSAPIEPWQLVFAA